MGTGRLPGNSGLEGTSETLLLNLLFPRKGAKVASSFFSLVSDVMPGVAAAIL